MVATFSVPLYNIGFTLILIVGITGILVSMLLNPQNKEGFYQLKFIVYVISAISAILVVALASILLLIEDSAGPIGTFVAIPPLFLFLALAVSYLEMDRDWPFVDWNVVKAATIKSTLYQLIIVFYVYGIGALGLISTFLIIEVTS